MRAGRRCCALVTVLAILLSAPLGAPRGCITCPPGCPMHAGKSGQGGKLGCHHGASRGPADGVCVRSTCGHEALTESPVTLRAVLAGPPAIVQLLAAEPVSSPAVRPPSLDAPEPPTDPPRAVLGSL